MGEACHDPEIVTLVPVDSLIHTRKIQSADWSLIIACGSSGDSPFGLIWSQNCLKGLQSGSVADSCKCESLLLPDGAHKSIDPYGITNRWRVTSFRVEQAGNGRVSRESAAMLTEQKAFKAAWDKASRRSPFNHHALRAACPQKSERGSQVESERGKLRGELNVKQELFRCDSSPAR